MDFTLICRPMLIECVAGRRAGARLLFQGGGLNFYVIGATAKRFDKLANVAMNKALEMGVQPRALQTRAARVNRVASPNNQKRLI